VFLPQLAVNVKRDREKLQKIWDRYLKIVFFLAVPLVTAGMAMADPIISFVYGREFSPAVFAFQILIVMAGLLYLITTLSRLLLVADLQKKNFYITMLGALLNVFLNFILIPRYSLYGAAIATLITFIVMFLLFIFFAKTFIPIRLVTLESFLTLIGITIASFVMYLSFGLGSFFRWSFLVVLPIGGLVYLVVFLGYHSVIRKIKKNCRR
jgi:O-antigen/teichoic acid export membrane protein